MDWREEMFMTTETADHLASLGVTVKTRAIS
jgi:hypothetical protein